MLLKEIEQAKHLSNDARIGGMLFANYFVGVSDSGEHLQKLIDACLLEIEGVMVLVCACVPISFSIENEKNGVSRLPDYTVR